MNTPKLRFKEFKGSWSQVALENLAKIERGKFSIRPRNDPRYFGGTMPFIQTGDVTGSSTYLKGFSQTLNNEGVKVSKVFPSETILITIAANIGDTTITEYPVACPDSVVAIQPKKELADTIFLKNLIDLQKDFLDSQATQNAQKNINLQVLKPLPLIVPTKKEQTKIATFLSSVDDKIAQLSQKSDLLSQYKQGMMQKLFSQQIRFKADDGSEFGEWQSVKFSEKFEFHNTNSFSRALLAETGEVMNIHYGDIHTKFSMLFDVKKESVPFLSEELSLTKINQEQYLKIGDLVIADASEDYKDIGKAIEIINLDNQKIVAGLHTYIARPRQPFALGFCGYLMQTFMVREQIKKLATGISVLGISKTNLNKIEVCIPCLEEQTKIANFLSAIDQKIEVVAQQIEQAKTWKKGLLQQMFV
jgi:type I restriction enzyme S subunit